MSDGDDWANVRFAAVDVETTGLHPERHHLLQVAIVTVDGNGRELARWSSFVRPARWPFVVVRRRRLHGISRRTLRGAPRLGSVVAQAAERLEGAIVVGHHLDFDRQFLATGARTSRVSWPDRPGLCTLNLSRSLDPGRQLSHRLPDVCERFGVPLERHHDALADAAATAALVGPLLRAAGVSSPAELALVVTPTGARPSGQLA